MHLHFNTHIFVILVISKVGPNDEVRPSCIVAFFNTQIDKKWSQWKNLGNMSKNDACTKFLGEIMHIQPDFMQAEVGSKKITLRSAMQHDAAEVIQKAMRGVIARNRFTQLMINSRRDDVQRLTDMLLVGIPVVVLKSDTGTAKRRVLALSTSANIQESKIFIYGRKNCLNTSVYLVDIADIRIGARSYYFKQVADAVTDEHCFSIICSERTIDIQVVQGEVTRNWLAGCLLLLVDKVLQQKEALKRGIIRGRRLLPCRRLAKIIDTDTKKFSDLMEKSFGVEEYVKGELKLQVLWLSWPSRRIFIGKPESTGSTDAGTERLVAAISSSEIRGIDIDDVAEVRAGTSICLFVVDFYCFLLLYLSFYYEIEFFCLSIILLLSGLITSELDEANVDIKNSNSNRILGMEKLTISSKIDRNISASKMVSIIGTERCIVLHFQSTVVRDKFLKRMQCFIFQNKQSKTKPLRLPPLGSSIDVPTRSKDEIQQLSENTTSSDGSVGVDQTA